MCIWKFTLPLWYTFPKSSTGGVWILNGVAQCGFLVCISKKWSLKNQLELSRSKCTSLTEKTAEKKLLMALCLFKVLLSDTFSTLCENPPQNLVFVQLTSNIVLDDELVDLSSVCKANVLLCSVCSCLLRFSISAKTASWLSFTALRFCNTRNNNIYKGDEIHVNTDINRTMYGLLFLEFTAEKQTEDTQTFTWSVNCLLLYIIKAKCLFASLYN